MPAKEFQNALPFAIFAKSQISAFNGAERRGRKAVGKPPQQKNADQTPLAKLNLRNELPSPWLAGARRGLNSAVPCSVEGHSARGFSHSGQTSNTGP